MTTTERWLFDGWELTNKTAWGWAHRDGTNEAAAFVGENTAVPARAGELWRPKVQGPGRFALDIWLKGATQSEVHDNWRLILRAMRRRNKLVTVDRYMPSGERIQCLAEVVGTIAPQHLSQRVWRCSVTFNIPDGVWRSFNAYQYDSPLGSTTAIPFPRTLTFTTLDVSTETNDELTYTLTGPGTNWYIYDRTDGVTGDWLKYNGAIPAGGQLILNSKTWGITYAGSWSPDMGAIQYNGARFLSIPAARPGATPQVRWEVASGVTASTALRVTGPRTYTT